MIICQGCGDRVPDLATEVETVARARYLGWRIFDGSSAAGTPLSTRWCPGCAERGVPRKTSKQTTELEGQLDFDI